MASTDAVPVPIKNQAFRVTLVILDADGDLVTGATGLDSEVSKDGGTFVDCTNEATEIATASGCYFLDLTATEMNADTVAIIVKTTSAGAKTTPIVLYPSENGDIKVNVTQWLGTAAATPTVAGVPEVDVTHWLGAAATPTISGTSDSGSTTTMVDAARTEADTDYWKGCVICFTSGTISGQCRLITGFTPATDTITFAPATTQAVGTQTYEIRPAGRADLQLWQGAAPNALVSSRLDASVGAVAADAITDAAVAADMDSYACKVWVVKESTTSDHYGVGFFKNGQPVLSGITSPTIQVIKASDGTDLIASTALTQIGSTGLYKKDESTNKMTAGAMYFAKIQATIDGATRTHTQQVGRDSV